MTNNDIEKTAEKANIFFYSVTKFDKDGWANAKTSAPIPFDLVLVETKTRKKVVAWWNELSWKGLRLDDTEIVLRWRKRSYERLS